jgi:hypothetical protein
VNLHDMFEIVMHAPVKCPLCHAPASEKTLVDRGGIKATAQGKTPESHSAINLIDCSKRPLFRMISCGSRRWHEKPAESV